MGYLKKQTAVVKRIETGTSSSGNDYARVVLHDGGQVDFYHDDFREELLDNEDEYVGFICDVFFEDRGYTVGKAIVPESAEKAQELLEKKIPDDFEGLTDEEKEDLIEKVEKMFERRKGDQSGLDQYEA